MRFARRRAGTSAGLTARRWRPKPGVMLESCVNGPLKFQNNYLVQGGRITVSRQWIGPNLGYVTIQELRP
ncbi:hypothetical protein DPM13_03105 [Paracoccus mutanolyticus]|uniref:Uncharacterized protein n=1 Tax=Paracoccus mutanolyticus TaxID=1499308 RepID=A0ABM6WPR5_9RHOB|nr:hypothetical protein DPM13_03105 [Paracoccus mutanolyticus]